MSQPGTAAVLSVIVPGVGQIYNGDFLRGIFWLIVPPGLWIGPGGMLGGGCHVIAAYTAYSRGRKRDGELSYVCAIGWAGRISTLSELRGTSGP